MEHSRHYGDGDSLAEMLNDCSIDAITAIDSAWRIIAWNTAAEQFSGLLKPVVLGRPLLEAVPELSEDQAVIEALKLALRGFKSFVPASAEFKHRQHVENHYIPLRDTAKNIIGVMNISHDVAHRIKAEQQLQQLNRQLEKRYKDLQKTTGELASFTYISSNNIKEPIKHVYTAVEQLIRNEGRNMSDSGKASFRRIQSSLHKMNLLLDDLLSLSHINILHKPDHQIDLEAVANEVVKALGQKIKEKQATVTIEKLCTVTGHKDQLFLLFYHLLDNALKFNESTQPTITITITCHSTWVEEASDGLMTQKEYYRIEVRDNGIGFDPEAAEKIFNMFEKLHPKDNYRGSGMGLAIARKIMDTHDGFIQAESSPGNGAVFYCYFPV